MGIKAKLIAVMMSMCLVVAIIIAGVYAASGGEIKFGGTVSFIARDVLCEVTGEVQNIGNESPTLQMLKWDLTTEPTTEARDSWIGNDLSFKDTGSTISYIITIKNLSDERYIDINLSNKVNPQEQENLTIKYYFENESGNFEEFDLSQTKRIPLNQTRRLKVEFSYTATDKSSDATISYWYELTMTGENHIQ